MNLYVPAGGGDPVGFRYDPAARRMVSADGTVRWSLDVFNQRWLPAAHTQTAAPQDQPAVAAEVGQPAPKAKKPAAKAKKPRTRATVRK